MNLAMGFRKILKRLLLIAVLLRGCSALPVEEKPRIVQAAESSAYNSPFVCTYHFNPTGGDRIVLGSCTIVSQKMVLIAVDTVDRLVNQTRQFWYNKLSQLVVIAGSDILYPVENVQYQTNIKKYRVRKLHVGYKESFAGRKVIENPKDLNDPKIERNALGELACDVGFLELTDKFVYSPYIMPAPLFSTSYNEYGAATIEFVNKLENSPWLYDTCTVSGWGATGRNELMQHRLAYVSMDQCSEILCTRYASTCLKYPVKFHHVCFKSFQYGDVCVYDQGAPVFCPWFSNSIFAVLTRSFDCGLENMPAVYTLFSYVGRLHQAITQQSFMDRPIDFNNPKYSINTRKQ